eukprot:147000-Prorocentrum_minimum.AAC.2
MCVDGVLLRVTPPEGCGWSPFGGQRRRINDHIGEVKENSGNPKDAANSRPIVGGAGAVVRD